MRGQSTMRLIILLGMTSIGTLVAIQLAGDQPAESRLVAAIIIGSMTGGLVGLSLLSRIRSRPCKSNRSSRGTKLPTGSSHPFQQRLQRFTHQATEESVVHSADRSKMPFWTAAQFTHRTSPKPARLIQHVLLRIRHLIHGQQRR